jgi:hypothetical protein
METERLEATVLGLKIALEQAADRVAQGAGDRDPDVVRWRAMTAESWEALPIGTTSSGGDA